MPKLTKAQVMKYIRDNGLEYAVNAGIQPEDIADKKLAAAWKEARDANQKIYSALNDSVKPEPNQTTFERFWCRRYSM